MRRGPARRPRRDRASDRREQSPHHRLLRRRHAARRSRSPTWRRRATAASRSATLFAAQVDFTHAGDLKVFVDEEQLEALEKRMAERGYLEGSKMADAFNMLRSNDLIWPYIINNYLRGKAPMPFDLLYWNSDATRMPAANHSFYLRNCYLDNTLSRGKMTIASVAARSEEGDSAGLQSRDARGPHRAGEIGVPRLEIFRRTGAIRARRAPATSPAWSIRRARPSTSIGPAARPARRSLDDWLDKAKEHPGSWWPDWLEWIKSHGDEQVAGAPARRRQAQTPSRTRREVM